MSIQEADIEPKNGDPIDRVQRRLLYTVPEAARMLAISRSKAYELMYAGRLRSVKIGGARRVPLTAIYEYIQWLQGDMAK